MDVSGLLEVHSLTKKFGPLTAVDDVSFSVAQGEVVGFLGPNGAGKSTTMKMIAGFLAPTSGRVQVNGHDVVEKPIEIKKCIGYLPEGIGVVVRVRSLDNGSKAFEPSPCVDGGRG